MRRSKTVRNPVLSIGVLVVATLLVAAAGSAVFEAYVHDVAWAPQILEGDAILGADGLHIRLDRDARIVVRDGPLDIFEGDVTRSEGLVHLPPSAGIDYPFNEFTLEATASDGLVSHTEDRPVGIEERLFDAKPEVAPVSYLRSSQITLGYRHFHLVSDMRLPPDDPWLREYDNGDITAGDFERHLTPVRLTAANGSYSIHCCGSVRYSRNATAAVVHIEETYDTYGSELPASEGDVNIVRLPLAIMLHRKVAVVPDSIQVGVDDYELERRDESWARTETERSLALYFAGELNARDVEGLHLKYAIFASPAHAIRWMSGDPLEDVSVLAAPLGVLAAILRTAPVGVWIVVAAGGARRFTMRPGLRLVRLIAIVFLPSLVAAALSLRQQYGVDSVDSPEGELFGGVAWALAFIAALAVVSVLARAARDRWAWFVFAAQLPALLALGLGVGGAGDVLREMDSRQLGHAFWYAVTLAALALTLAVLFLPALSPRVVSRTTWRGKGSLLGAATIAAVALLHRPTLESIGPWLVTYGLYPLGTIAFALAAWWVATREHAAARRIARAPRGAIALFLALACGSLYPVVLDLPVALLIAVPLIWVLVRAIDPLGGAPRIDRASLFEEALRAVDRERVGRALSAIDERIFSPDADPEKDDLRAQRLRNKLTAIAASQQFAGVDVGALALGGPMFDNPVRGAAFGFAIGAGTGFALLLPDASASFGYAATAPAPALSVLSTIAEAGATQGIAGAAFALVLHRLHGRMALVKAFLLALAISLAVAPAQALVGASNDIIPGALREMLVFGVIGACADLWVIRRIRKPWFSTTRLLGLAGLGAYAAVATLLLGSVGAAATGVLTDTVTELVKHVQLGQAGPAPH